MFWSSRIDQSAGLCLDNITDQRILQLQDLPESKLVCSGHGSVQQG
jgi:hypothetical protein